MGKNYMYSTAVKDTAFMMLSLCVVAYWKLYHGFVAINQAVKNGNIGLKGGTEFIVDRPGKDEVIRKVNHYN